MVQTPLPPQREMFRALVERDASFDGVFFTGVRTTGIFCRPTCPAKKPQRPHVEFFPSARDALAAGYRACLRCRPLEVNGQPPEWLRDLLRAVERDPTRRWTDTDLRVHGVEPSRVRRWFQAHHGMTFHAYNRARRLGAALGRIRHGDSLGPMAYEHGYESDSGFREAFAQLFGTTPGRSRGSTHMVVTRLLTPIGPMIAGATDEGVTLLEFVERRMLERQVRRLVQLLDCRTSPGENAHIERLSQQLEQYFDGARREFDVPLVVPGTEFQQSCWRWLQQIPYGETRSYADQARALGKPDAQRPVGRANGENRIAIVIPCHRVVKSDGALAGYGGGKWRKQWLIDHELRHADLLRPEREAG